MFIYQCFVGKPDDILVPNLGGLLEEVGKTTVTQKIWLVKSDILPWRVPFGKRNLYNYGKSPFYLHLNLDSSLGQHLLNKSGWTVGHGTNLIQIFDLDPHGFWVPHGKLL